MANYVGKPVPRKEDRRLLMGRGCYTADLSFPGMVEAAVLRSSFAHALITRLDVTAARESQGVIAVYTAADLEGIVKPFTRPFYATVAPVLEERTGLVIRPYFAPVLAADRVLRVGEPIAVVVAENRYLAEDALEVIEVDYEPLEALVDPERSLEDDAPRLIPGADDNIHARFTSQNGDVEGAFAAADRVLRERIRVGRSVGVPMETRGTVATFDRGRRELVTYSTQQRPHLLRTYLSEMLDLPEENVRVVCPDTGGSFGGGIYNEEAFVSAIAMNLGRPVRWIEDRQENLLNARQSRDQMHDVEVAYDDRGRILALRDRFIVDCGAYNPFTITLSFNTQAHLRGEFKIETYEITGLCVATNKLQTTPVRGAGRPEAVFVMERVVDMIARRLGRDPAEVRKMNLIPGAEMPYDTKMLYRDGNPMVYDGGDYPEQLRMVLDMAGYEDLRRQQRKAREEGRRIGIGLSSYVEGSGYGPYEGAVVKVDATGNVVVHSGSNPHGQAHETTLSQVCADALGTHVDRVRVRAGDTALVQHGGGTFASRSAVTAGSAVHLAARKLREKILLIAGELLEADPADLAIDEGRVFPSGAPDRGLSFADIAAAATPGGGRLPEGMEPGLEARGYYVPPTSPSRPAHTSRWSRSTRRPGS
jgi:carbon-monoxide dehydrogenase large subunit